MEIRKFSLSYFWWFSLPVVFSLWFEKVVTLCNFDKFTISIWTSKFTLKSRWLIIGHKVPSWIFNLNLKFYTWVNWIIGVKVSLSATQVFYHFSISTFKLMVLVKMTNLKILHNTRWQFLMHAGIIPKYLQIICQK